MDAVATKAGPSPERDDPKLLDLRQMMLVIRRRLWWVVATVALVMVLTAIAYVIAPRRYTSTASVALDRQVQELVTQPKGDGTLPTDSPSVDTEVQVFTAPRVVGEVVDSLKLAAMPGFGQPDDGRPAVAPAQARQRAIRRLIAGLSVKRLGTSYAIGVSFTSEDPGLSTQIVNTVVDQYIEDQRAQKAGERDRETALLRERLVRLRGDVIAAEAAVARYRAQRNLINVERDSTSTQQEISVLNTQLATAEADRAAARARLTEGAANGSPVIGALRQQQAQLSAQQAELAGRYGPLHPDRAKVERQLADVNASIAKETTRVRQGLAAESRVAEGRAAAIRGALNGAEGKLSAGNSASVQLNELERTAESARTLYQSLLDRYQQQVAGQGTDRSRSSVIAYAMVPTGPTFPNPTVFGVAGLMAALIAAGAVVLVLEQLERGFKSRRDVESRLGLLMVGNVPDLRRIPGVSFSRRDPLGPADYLVENEGSVFGEAFRGIRTALRLGQGEKSIRSLAVCSALPDEGKTTTAICLARSAAMAGLNVLLVDCDLRRRASSRTLAADPQKGLTDLLLGEASFEEVVVRDTRTEAWILPQGSGKTGYDLITQSGMETLVRALGQKFDLVVLDTAPVLPLAEARAVAAMADGILLVTRWRATPVPAARLAADLLERAGGHIAGAVLTRVNLKEQARSGDGDEMIYYKKFAKYYV